MEQFENRLRQLEEKVDDATKMVRKMYLAFMWVIIISVLLFVLPFIGLLFALPSFIDSYTTALGGI